MRRLTVLVTLSAALSAQSAATLTSAGYAAPGAIQAAPGQVVNLYFHGLASRPSATGLTLTVHQDSATPLPILAFRQDQECDAPVPACLRTTVKVQFPFTLAPATPARLEIEEDGRPTRPYPLDIVPINAHLLTSCDDGAAGPCNRAAFHPDGRPVSPSDPAFPGETIRVYAYGLGQVNAGGEAPVGPYRIWAELRKEPLNASASAPRHLDAAAFSRPGDAVEKAVLLQDRQGVYAVTIRIPATFRPVIPCGPEINANSVALISSPAGSEPVPICVQ